jgi:hypothetical protein
MNLLNMAKEARKYIARCIANEKTLALFFEKCFSAKMTMAL